MLLHSYVAEHFKKSDLPIQKSQELTNNELNRKQTVYPSRFQDSLT